MSSLSKHNLLVRNRTGTIIPFTLFKNLLKLSSPSILLAMALFLLQAIAAMLCGALCAVAWSSPVSMCQLLFHHPERAQDPGASGPGLRSPRDPGLPGASEPRTEDPQDPGAPGPRTEETWDPRALGPRTLWRPRSPRAQNADYVGLRSRGSGVHTATPHHYC